MNRFVVGVLVLSSVLLVGCGGGSSSSDTDNESAQRIVQADGFVLTLPEGYVDVLPALVENKQLINKVLISAKVPSSQTGEFEQNIIFTRSSLPPEINYEQFWTLNAQKMKAELAGYVPGEKEVRVIECTNRTIQGLKVTFSLHDQRQKPVQKIRIAQYQFVENYRGYILSSAYASEDGLDEFDDILDTFICGTVGGSGTALDSA